MGRILGRASVVVLRRMALRIRLISSSLAALGLALVVVGSAGRSSGASSAPPLQAAPTGSNSATVPIVDAPRRPREGALARIPTDQIWWDVHDLWRGRWGHRLYGELIQFDGAGRFVRTVLAEDIIRSGRLPLPDESMAPATPDREGG